MGKLLSMNEYLLFTSAHLDINLDFSMSLL